MNKIMYCSKCNIYTLKEVCKCGEKSVIRTPPKYSLKDGELSKYRRMVKEEGERNE
jgi:rRNA maturation protein Nop10